MNENKLLKLEDLNINDYKVLICALDCAEMYHLEIEEFYYDELMSKLERNLDKLEYNESL